MGTRGTIARCESRNRSGVADMQSARAYNARRRLERVCFCCALVAMTGCAPRVMLAPPVEWPAEWRGRKLYHTPRALIYATNDAAAGEADRLTNRIGAAHALPLPASESEAKGLIVVVDRGDDPVCDQFDELLTIFLFGQSQLADREAPSEAHVASMKARLTSEQAALAPILRQLMVMVPIPVAGGDVSNTLGFPGDAVPNAAWAGLLPTEAMIRDASGTLTDQMIDMAARENKIPTTTRWLITPMMPTIRNLFAGEILKLRDVAYESIIRQNDPNWIADRDARNRAASAWNIVKKPGNSTMVYAKAYETTRAAADRLADDTHVLRSLAAAEFRTQRYEETLATLDRIQELERQRVEASGAGAFGDFARLMMPNVAGLVDNAVSQASTGQPGDLAFRAMAQFNLGQKTEATETHRQLSEMVKSRYRKSADARSFLFEVTSLLGVARKPASQPETP